MIEQYGESGDDLIVKQNPSRNKIRVGNVFCIKLNKLGFIWGCVVLDDAYMFEESSEKHFLVYIFNVLTRGRVNPPALKNTDLLIAPFLTGSFFWRSGVFENVSQIEIDNSIKLEEHYFFDHLRSEYRNERGQKVLLGHGVDNRLVGFVGLPTASMLGVWINESLEKIKKPKTE